MKFCLTIRRPQNNQLISKVFIIGLFDPKHETCLTVRPSYISICEHWEKLFQIVNQKHFFIKAQAERKVIAVVRDKISKIIVVGVRRVVVTWLTEISEAATTLFAVELATRLGYRRVHIEVDTFTVIMAIEN